MVGTGFFLKERNKKPGYSDIEALWCCENNCYHFTVFKREISLWGEGLGAAAKGN